MFLQSSPHQNTKLSTSKMMRMVIYCLIPGVLAQTLFFGWGVWIQIMLAILTAVACEAAIMELRKRPIEPVIGDYSGILTAVLLAIAIPSYAPWWVIVLGTAFAIVMVKQLYGGLGHNLFNPAMAGYVMLLISFPVQMTAWVPDQSLALKSFSLMDSFSVIFTGFTLDGYSLEQMRQTVDGITGATPLDELKLALGQGLNTDEILQREHLDSFGNTAGFWVNCGFLIGGIIMLRKNLIYWHIPVSVVAGLFVAAGLGFVISPDTVASPSYHLFSGATMLAAFFIATDPVSASTTVKGRLIYGFLIGALVYLVRTFGGYPDAFAFAILIANMLVPLLDYYTKPKAYGSQL